MTRDVNRGADDGRWADELGRLADIAETLATEIGAADPDFCALADKAETLAHELRSWCAHPPRFSGLR